MTKPDTSIVLVRRKHLDKKHGDPIECPTCGMPGLLDNDTPDGQPVAWPHKSVWWNNNCGWECSDCYDK